MKFVISGGSGFVGTAVVNCLLAAEHEVVLLRRAQHLPNQIESVDHVRTVRWALGDCHFDKNCFEDAILIHIAWDFLPDFHTERHLTENLPNSIDLFRTVVEHGGLGIIGIGTCFEYGLRNGPIQSECQTDPILPYAIAKDALRRYLFSMKVPDSFIRHWSRLFYMYGPNQSEKSLLSQLGQAVSNGDKIFRMSGGEQLRDYLHVNDVAARICSLAAQPWTGVSNISSGKPISITRLVKEYMESHGFIIDLDKGFYPYPDYEPMAFWGVPTPKKESE